MKKRRNREKRPLGAMRERQSETVPSYARILSRHNLCAADTPVATAYDLWMHVSADPVVQQLKPRSAAPRTNMLAAYLNTAAALAKLSDEQKKSLLQRIAAKYALYGATITEEGVREYR